MKMPLHVFADFSKGWYKFYFLLICELFMYSGIKHLSILCVADIFSFFVAYVFSVFVVPYREEQFKFLMYAALTIFSYTWHLL